MRHINAELLQCHLKLDLYDAGWLDQGSYPGQSQRQFTMDALVSSFMKKFHNDKTDSARDAKALALFLECNERCRNYGGVQPRNLLEHMTLSEMKVVMYDFFNPRFWGGSYSERSPILLNLSDIATHFGLGNGTNIGAGSTDFYSKLVLSSMSHTNPVLPILFRQAISGEKIWSDVEAFRSGTFSTELVRGSRLSFVPKSWKISRTICTEPVLNMLFQKGIAGVLEKRLFEVFRIDLSNQPFRNSDMAREGSIDGRFGTIDLSSASDTISLRLIDEMVPKESRNWLLRCRSPITTLPDGTDVELHMISSMGNGYTFPLQTAIFASLVTAAYRILGIPIQHPRERQNGNFAVFGDDIIVVKEAYNLVVDCLEILGFSVNRDKSFNQGFFRESCGSDWFQGYNTRGIYLKKLRTAGDFYSAINRLNFWSSKHGIPLPRTIGYLRSGCRFIGVPFDEADDAGIKVPYKLLRSPRTDRNGSTYYVASVNSVRSVRIPSVDADGTIDNKELKRIRRVLPNFAYNPDGLLFCFLAGWLRNGQLGLRSLSPKAVLRRRVCPGWDNRYAARGVSHEFHERWKTFVEGNLVSSS